MVNRLRKWFPFIKNGNETISTNKTTCEEQSRKVKNIYLNEVKDDKTYWACTMNGVYPIRGYKLKHSCSFITSLSAKKGFIYATKEEAMYIYDCIMGVRNGK